ncbi:MAG: hydantoinase/oxoprolinase family protein [Actinobacteria bacterium]|nr:hydantoinase/oxoprolinase family protein [Actinomycetota bacterium]
MAGDWHIGGDVGGTFTDLIAWSEGGTPVLVKTPSTLDNQADGILRAVAAAVPEEERSGIVELLHGTTTATNAILERQGVATALVTTEGFRDVLELGRRTRPKVYGLRGEFEPHVPRWLRFEVPGRLDRSGVELIPLDEDAVRSIAAAIAAAEVGSVAVTLLHSYANPDHEDRVASILEAELPGIHVSRSVEVLPEIREFERTVATTLNAYVEPILSRYLDDLRTRVAAEAPAAQVRVMQGNGGTIPVAELAGFPIRSVISGPAAGLTGAARVLDELGIDAAIACDMGGTSFDVGVIEAGKPIATTDLELEYNVPIRIPTLDVRTIGAGGGSIAHLDDGGMLRVGPLSAGSVPGPIWYGKGGRQLTVTDANVLAGRLLASSLGTDLAPTVSEGEIWATVADAQPDLVAAFPDPIELAEAVLRVVVATMAGCVREVTVRSGRDPRDFAIVSYGGAGPLHACEIAREMGIRRVVVPAFPGLLSAYGCLIADLVRESIVGVYARLADLRQEELAADLHERAVALIAALREIEPGPVEVQAHYECQFERQTHTIYVEAGLEADPEEIREAFLARYRQLYGELLPKSPIEVRSVRVEARAPRRAVGSWSLGDVAPVDRSRPDGVEHWRPELPVGTRIKGRATISAPDATLYLPPRCTAEVVGGGHIIVEVEP